MNWKPTIAFLAGLAAVAAMPVLGDALRDEGCPRCATDGVALEEGPLARVEQAEGPSLSFCSVGCAETWCDTPSSTPVRVLVRDDTTGADLDARSAWFVVSRVIAQPATHDRVHAFGSREDALRHASTYRGRVLVGSERPFGRDE